MFTLIAVFAAGVITGAFSHKWLATKFKATTGQDAQAVADQAKAAIKSVAPKV